MLKIEKVVEIAQNYIETVTREEGAIFPNFRDFGTGIIFSYQSKDFIKGNKKALWLGNHQPFIVEKKKGLIYHLFREPNTEEELINKFLSNKIDEEGLSLAEVYEKFDKKPPMSEE